MITATATITRFDLYIRAANEAEGTDEREVVRFFEKRKLVGEFETEDCSRYPEGFDSDDFTAWLATGPKGALRTVTEAMDYLSAEVGDDGEVEEENEGGSIVPAKYRIIYGAAQNCGDDVAQTLTEYVTTGRTSKKSPDGGLDRGALRAVAEVNNIGDRLAVWEDNGLNGGLLRMNCANVLRGMVRRGERVEIGETVWEANPALLEARAEKRKAGRKAKGGAA